MYYQINNPQFWILRFQWTGWRDKLFWRTGWHEELVEKQFRRIGWYNKWFRQAGWCNKWFWETGWRRKRSKKRFKQRSKSSYLHYQPHRRCVSNSRYFGLAPHSAPKCERHGCGTQLFAHFRTPRKVSRASRDGSTPQDVNAAEANARLNPPSPSSKPISISSAWTGTQ